MKEFGSIFHFSKGPESPDLYGGLALCQFLNEQLNCLKHQDSLVTAIILRRGCYIDTLTLKDLRESNNIANEPVKSPEIVFWSHFENFVQITEKTTNDVMCFLVHAKDFLIQLNFQQSNPDVFAALENKCTLFDNLRLSVKGVFGTQNTGNEWVSTANEALNTVPKWKGAIQGRLLSSSSHMEGRLDFATRDSSLS